ncbi:mutS 4 [Caerostris extrusa]|uniref:MutS 4 n=1 Tax=Caerostris extrusa TaxID=172846 RepID=A0AAV4XX76_CAEEX|nr:mutS 4 [Caerostris extrusa]
MKPKVCSTFKSYVLLSTKLLKLNSLAPICYWKICGYRTFVVIMRSDSKRGKCSQLRAKNSKCNLYEAYIRISKAIMQLFPHHAAMLYFKHIIKFFSDDRFIKLQEKISLVIHTDARWQKGVLNMHMQKCFAVKISCKLLPAGKELPPIFLKVNKCKNFITCTTEDVIKLNDRIQESLNEIYLMSDLYFLLSLAHVCTLSDHGKN